MLGKIFDSFRILNLDVALGSVFNTYMFSRVLGVDPGLNTYIVLFNTVWIIYTLDRIIDNQFQNFPVTRRHTFHRQNRIFLLIMIFGACLINGWLLFYIPPEIILNGCILGGIMMGYFVMIRFMKGRFPKEGVIALLYTCGVVLAPFSLIAFPHPLLYFTIFLHFLLAFSNLLIFSIYESAIDMKSGQYNLAVKWGQTFTKSLTQSLLVFSLIANAYIIGGLNWGQGIPIISIIFCAMATLLLIVLNFPRFFGKHEMYRFWADASFLLPGVVLVL